MTVQVREVRVRLGGQAVLHDISLTIPDNGMTAIIGPNGSGKSTLLRTIYRRLRPDAGTVLIDDQDVWRGSARASARRRAVLTQHQSATEGMTTHQVVLTGRHCHSRWGHSTRDREAVDHAIAQCRIADLADRMFETLSGGQRQRVLLARAVAQKAPLLLLDEPTNHLDPAAAIQLLDLLENLPGTKVAVLHDLDQAVARADHLIVLLDGSVHSAGPVADAFTSTMTEEVFGLASAITTHPLTGLPHVLLAPARSR